VLIPKARGTLSAALFDTLRSDLPLVSQDVASDDRDDAAIALWTLYELHYGSFDDVADDLEWHPGLLALRARLEADFEAELRARMPARSPGGSFEDELFAFIDGHDGLSLAAFVQRDADREQVLDLLRHRSVYHLKESDPTAWVVPRLQGRPKAALMELQFDEYGAGDPARLHARLFARGLEASGLSAEYGVYVNDAPVEILEQNNAMSLFGLHRRLRGAAMGHLAAFEATSAVPSGRMTRGLARLGFPAEIVDYYDEHIEADAIHEQLAVRFICAPLVQESPEVAADVFLGAFSCLDLEERVARRLLGEWATP
jgi:hypothetical protein